MNLSAPTQVVFLVSVILATLAIIGVIVAIPVISQYAFWVVTLAFVVLAADMLMKGARRSARPAPMLSGRADQRQSDRISTAAPSDMPRGEICVAWAIASTPASRALA
jgi:hypothetical protein